MGYSSKKEENKRKGKWEFKEKTENPFVFSGKEITLSDLQGYWITSHSQNITVIHTSAKFSKSVNIYQIENAGNIFTLDGWVLKKQSDILTWKKENQNDVFWYRNKRADVNKLCKNYEPRL